MRIPFNNALRFTTIAAALSVSIVAATALPRAAQARTAVASDAQVEIDNVVNVIGFDGVKPNSAGRLIFSGDDIAFSTDKMTGSIPFGAVRAVAIEHSTKALMRGIKGTLAGFAPQGAGQLYGAIRPGAELLTLLYADENQALHGAVVLLPKSRKDDVLRALARGGLTPTNAVMADRLESTPDARGSAMKTRSTAPGERPSVRIALPVSGRKVLPVAYVAGAYEELIAQTAKSGLFESVWRQGDVRTNADALNLTVSITRFKKGNAGVRGAIPVVGMIAGKTLITANLHLASASGTVLLDKEVKGSKRMIGESMAATKSLAQRVTSSLEEVPGFRKGEPSQQVASN